MPEKYVDLYLNFEKNNTKFKAKFIGTDKFPVEHLKTEAEANNVIAACKGIDFVINNISRKEKHEAPKPPFCTATFQQEASNRLNLTTKDAMSVAQQLYEAGKISYMRTDDQTFAPDFLTGLLKPYIVNNFGKAFYNAPREVKNAQDAQQGHECLRITDPALTPDLFEKEDPNTLHQKVYKLIWQRTVAACLPDAIYAETAYDIYNGQFKFRFISKELLNEGYKAIYSYQDTDKAEEKPIKETFSKNERLTNTKLVSQAKETTPPARYKEATFLKELQKQGIGRPSTYATIVETVLSSTRGYCELDNKFMVPTNKGRQLIEFLDRNFSNIINIGYTRQMEESLDKIADGKLSKLEMTKHSHLEFAFLTNFYNTLETTIKNSTEVAATTLTTTETCPNCGKTLVVKRSKYGNSFLACPGWPNCRFTKNLK